MARCANRAANKQTINLRIMKQYLQFALVAACFVTLCACATEHQPSVQSTTTTSDTTVSRPVSSTTNTQTVRSN